MVRLRRKDILEVENVPKSSRLDKLLRILSLDIEPLKQGTLLDL